jgi:asparagine synthase (glutamine-hydrolysing)
VLAKLNINGNSIMCGIIGAIGYGDLDSKCILSTIAHRGPDSQGVFEGDNIFLGHVRLSILDLSEMGRQPMFDSTGRYIIIFNGEIYNHLEIRQKLINKYSFLSSSDTETLLYGYIEYGEVILQLLNGIFAFAIFDRIKGEIFIARDQFGIKPLYYYQKDGKFLFGSEIKSFLGFEGFDKSLDLSALVNYLTFLWSPGEQTPFLNVKKLSPGHFIKINMEKLDSPLFCQYYDIPFLGQYSSKSESELIAELDFKLLRAVQRQLISDVPVAFFLSGGLDSSAIVAMAKKLLPNQRLRCYTINASDGEDEGFSEDLIYARKVAKYLDLDLVEVDANVDIVSNFDKMVYHLDEPQADAAPLNVLNICERAKKDGYKVLLGGTAGDDLFSGYRRHQALKYELYIRFLPKFLLRVIKVLISKFKSNNALTRRLKKLTSNLDKSKWDRIYGYFEWLPLDTIINLFNSESKKKVDGYAPKKLFFKLLKNIPEEKSDLNKALYWEMKTFLPDHNLNYTDKLSMATGVEVRVPFLDVELVEFSTTIPPHIKMKGNTTKYILKKLMERYLPKEVIYRAKAGFGAPVRQWVTHDLDKKINSYLSTDAINRRCIFDAEKVQQLLKDNKEGKIDASYPIWGLLAIESWHRKFVDKND